MPKIRLKKNKEQLKLDLHHRKAEAAQKMMSQNILDSKNPESDTCVLSYDLQEQMYIPALTRTQVYGSLCASILEYISKMKRNIFCIRGMDSIGKRGYNEIASCHNTVKHHRAKIGFVVRQLRRKGYFNRIVHKFPQTGHKFLSCNRKFGCIEKAERGQKPEAPMDLIRIMASLRLRNSFVINHKYIFQLDGNCLGTS